VASSAIPLKFDRLKGTESQSAIRRNPLIRFARKLPLKARKAAKPNPSQLSITQANQSLGSSSRTTVYVALIGVIAVNVMAVAVAIIGAINGPNCDD
jgi:hypothetical protein